MLMQISQSTPPLVSHSSACLAWIELLLIYQCQLVPYADFNLLPRRFEFEVSPRSYD